MMERIAIYTCIIGGYDELQQPRVLEDGFDFICFVGRGEKTEERDGVWEIRELPESFGNPTLDARWPKMHPHLLLPEYACSVWIDGNVALLDGTLYRAARIKAAAGVKYSGVTHPDRDCAYEEARKCLDMKYLTVFGLLRVWLFLALHGLPRHAGLMENNLIFRRHDDPDIVAGGLAVTLVSEGAEVVFDSLTNGGMGHHRLAPAETAAVREDMLRNTIDECRRTSGEMSRRASILAAESRVEQAKLQSQVEELTRSLAEEQEMRRALNARVIAMTEQYVGRKAGADYSERDNFLELEKERDAFERVYGRNWKKAKRKIRKKFLWGKEE